MDAAGAVEDGPAYRFHAALAFTACFPVHGQGNALLLVPVDLPDPAAVVGRRSRWRRFHRLIRATGHTGNAQQQKEDVRASHRVPPARLRTLRRIAGSR